jgi:hypothetical protein
MKKWLGISIVAIVFKLLTLILCASAMGQSSPEPLPSPTSLSPDKKWEYKCLEYSAGDCLPQIVKAPLTHHSYETVAFYQLRGDKWEALRSLADEAYPGIAIRIRAIGNCAIGLTPTLQSFTRLAREKSSQLSSSRSSSTKRGIGKS